MLSAKLYQYLLRAIHTAHGCVYLCRRAAVVIELTENNDDVHTMTL